MTLRMWTCIVIIATTISELLLERRIAFYGVRENEMACIERKEFAL